ncbi:class I SAM-dependent methyltransferase [Parvularcula dongshanensis]|uniref:Putative methyltransferase n=1 Tax=Parvularcula dongshanensis TaxID=1173995 RepID=A0A840HZD5_9PROT|nr:methyltransferase domain-containing protein [Parvularcula dongshanensis]MBB4657787.1 putative methyltransferase [Parvularcula dongshanensis]
MRLLIASAALILAACAAPQDGPVEGEAADSLEPAVRADINAAYLDPDLDVPRLNEGFSSESREVYAARDAVTAALGIRPGDAVADVGAGTGIYAEPFSRAVGPEGTVYAVDIAEPLLAYVDAVARREGLTNLRTVLGRDETTTLPPSSLDLVFTSDVYHHFEQPRAMNAHLFEALRPGGRYAVLDFDRGPGAEDWILRHVRSSKADVIAEIAAAGFSFVGEVPVEGLKENYLLLFAKP